ncbi:MAG: 4Fe-4S dicluster domain-containing protein [Desulfovibrio sp.]
MDGKSFFVNLTKCIACRGCQVACKQWKKLPAGKTENHGSYQNPPDMNDHTLKIIRFSEKIIDGQLRWLFMPDQCRHCLIPPCQMATTNPDAITQDKETGAVIHTELTARENFQDIRDACPYDIPRQDPVTKASVKCDMCLDRVRIGLEPACVKTCPSNTMHFGDRAEMLKLAQEALAEAKPKFPLAEIVDQDDVRVLFLAAFPPANYYDHLTAYAENGPRKLNRMELFATLARPVKRMRG